jgi:membrane associated rhomboid family serine protease
VHCTRCGRPICTDCMQDAAVGYQCPDCLREAQRTGPRRRARIVLGRPGRATTILIAVNVAVFLVEIATGAAGGIWTGGSDAALVRLGALQPILVAANHEYWRLFTAMFLHASILHILLNMYALYLFGYVIEGTLGTWRFLAIYFVAGFLASVTSFTFSDPRIAGVGASGAIFGLLGAWVAYNLRRRETAMGAANLRGALVLIAINLFLGFSIPNVDNFAHLGGLVSGFVCGLLVEGLGPRHLRQAIQVGGFAVLIAVGLVLVVARTNALTGALFG